MRGPEFYEPEVSFSLRKELEDSTLEFEDDGEVEKDTDPHTVVYDMKMLESLEGGKAPENPYTGAVSPYEAA